MKQVEAGRVSGPDESRIASAVARVRAEDLTIVRRAGAFAILMIFEFFYAWCWNTVDVLRPQIVESLHVSLTAAGAGYSAQGLGALTGAVVFGQLADRFGRRRTVFVVVIGYAVVSCLGVLVHSYAEYLTQRFVLGLFLGAIFPVIAGLYMGLFAGHLRGKIASFDNGVYNLSVMALGWSLSLPIARANWHNVLVLGAIPPLVLLPLLFLVPDDRRMISWGLKNEEAPAVGRLPIMELFKPEWVGRTVLLFFLVGLNFFAYQAFAGWVTTFLEKVRGFSVATAGSLVALQFFGAFLGSLVWGWFCDRFGRRVGAYGFFGGALVVLAYLFLLAGPEALRWGGFTWGFMIASSVAWGPWMCELFPFHLRSTAISIFNWGRLISMTAPLITGFIAEHYGLRISMVLSAVAFGVGGVVWLLLPETLERRPEDPAPPAPATVTS